MRFVLGLSAGALAAMVTYAIGQNPNWTTGIGTGVALLVWLGPDALDYIDDWLD
jgi:hypothetical protein